MAKRSTLPRTPWIAVFATVATIVTIVATLLYRREARRSQDELYENLKVVGSLKAAQILHWREEREGDATAVAANPTVIEVALNAVSHTGREVQDTALRASLEVMATAFEYSNILLATTDGRVLFSLRGEIGTLGPNTRAAVDSASYAPVPVLSNLFRGEDGVVHVDVAHAVRDKAGRTVAILILRTSTGTYLYPLLGDWPSTRKTAASFMLRRDGDDVIVLKDQLDPHDGPVATVVPVAEHELAPVQAALGATGRFSGEDHRHVRVLADLRAVPRSPWFLVTTLDESEVREITWAQARVIVFTALMVVLLAAATVAYGYRARQNGRLRHLYAEEQREREAQAVFRTTFYSIGDGVITTDTLQRVTAMNRVAEQLTGWTDSDARGRPLAAVYRPVDESTRAPRPLFVLPSEGTDNEADAPVLNNHTLLLGRDREYPIASTSATIRDDGGSIKGAVVVFRDETAQRHQQNVLLQEERMASMGRLAGGVAHDFNNLLAIIMNATELVMREMPKGSDAQNDLEEVQRACARATALTRQLLTFSRRQVVKPQAVDINALVVNMESMLVRLLAHRATLALACMPGHSTVLADPVQLEQVVMNLAINARDALPDGGTIRITTRLAVLDGARALATGTLNAGEYVALAVCDSGIGMDEATQKRVFEPFFTTKPPGEGTGLGLATVHGIVQRAGGGIEIDSAPGRGTAFTVYFPLAQYST